MNKKIWYIVGVVVVIVIIGWLVSKNSQTGSNNNQQNNSPVDQNQAQDNNSNSPESLPSAQLPGNTWQGTLKASDNSKKGNLMLVTADRTIYIQTSRDFSTLLDKQVVVSYDGTYDNFRLGDIVAK